MRFSILGPLAVRVGGHDRTPTAPMPRRVLALMLLQANRTVPIATLVDELWEGDDLPRLARKTVQTYIYQLRKALGEAGDGAGHLIVSRPQSYLLEVGEGQLDLWDFEQLADEGRAALADDEPGRAADLLHGAMGLWRGDPLADLVPGPLLSIEVARLTDRYLTALELRLDADLRLGRHREVVGELSALTAKHPMHEAFYAQLMVAAYRCGHRRDALAAYHRLRQQMIEELGLEPSERLQQLQRDILSESQALEGRVEPPVASTVEAEPAPAQLPLDLSGFIGRGAEVAELEGFCRPEPGRTAPRLVAVVGPPGIGKTTLAVHAAHRLRRVFPHGQLWASLHDDDGDRPVEPSRILAGWLAAAGYPAEQIPDGVVERANLFRTWSADRELLLVLDDAAGVDQLTPLLPAGGGCAVLITSRTRLPGLAGVTTVQVGPLSAAEGVALMSQVAGADRVQADPAGARQAVQACHGLPLGIRAAGEKLAARPPWPVAKLTDRLTDDSRCLEELGTGPFDLRAYMLRAWRRMDDRFREAMRKLAALGEVFTLRQAANALGVDQLTAECPVGRLVECNLLAVVGTTPDGGALFRFPRLLRLAIRELTPHRTTLHLAVS